MKVAVNVTAFDSNWNRIASIQVEVDENTTKSQVLMHHIARQKIRPLLPSDVKDVQIALSLNGEPTPEQARKVFEENTLEDNSQ